MPYASKTLITTEESFAARDKRLSICLGADGFSFAETTADHVLLTFGEAKGEHSASMTGAIGEVKSYFKEIGITALGYANMELVVMTDEHTWVPNELFSIAMTRQYLKLVGGHGFAVMTSNCAPLKSTSVFSANDQLVSAFKVALPGLNVVNQHVKFMGLRSRSANHPLLIIHWRSNKMDIAGFREGQCLYSNTLSVENDENALFRTIEIVKNFKLESEDTELLMMGEVDRERFGRFSPYFPLATLYNGHKVSYINPAFKRLHTYRHALLLM